MIYECRKNNSENAELLGTVFEIIRRQGSKKWAYIEKWAENGPQNLIYKLGGCKKNNKLINKLKLI